MPKCRTQLLNIIRLVPSTMFQMNPVRNNTILEKLKALRDIPPSTLWQPMVVAPLIVLMLSIFYVFIDARPYLVSGTDTDHDYYYNALLILDTGFPGRANHPGIPLYYFTALLVGIGKIFNASPQFALNLGSLAVAGFTAASLTYFFSVLRHVVPRTILWLSLAILLSWPTILFYLSALASDAIAISLAIAAIAYFWKHWIIEGKPTRKQTVILAIIFGTAASLKLTVLPVIAITWFIVALGVAYTSFTSANTRLDYLDAGSFFPMTQRFTAVLAGPVVSAATFLFFIAPAWGVFAIFLRSAGGRTNSSGWLGPSSESSTSFLAWYAENAPYIPVLIGTAFAVTAVGLLFGWLGRKTIKRSQISPGLILGGLYAGILFVAFLGGMMTLVDQWSIQGQDQPIIANTPGWNVGSAVRQLGPSFASLVVVMMFVGLFVKELQLSVTNKQFIKSLLSIVVPILSIGLVIWTITIVAADRRQQTNGWENQIIPAMEIIADDPAIDGRVAYGMSSNGMTGIFELWGDIRYGEEREKAVDNYPRLALFDLKQAVVQIEKPEKNKPTEYTGTKLIIQNIYRSLPKYLPPFRDIIALKLELAADDLIRGDLTNESVSRIAYLKQEREALNGSREGIEKVLIRNFGEGNFYEIEYLGRNWEVFDITR